MPTYKPGTRQWAEQRLWEIEFGPAPIHQDEKIQLTREWHRLCDQLDNNLLPDDPNPVYTKEEIYDEGSGGPLG